MKQMYKVYKIIHFWTCEQDIFIIPKKHSFIVFGILCMTARHLWQAPRHDNYF